jgi:hypothetical protein
VKASVVVALVLVSACARLFHSGPSAADSLYWQAVENLDVSNKSGTLDTAIAKLDAYLALPGTPAHAKEAGVLRTLARNSQQLARVEATLQQVRANPPENRPRESDAKARDEESLKEIQRLKDELAAANAELERIKKRLAAPPKP